MSVNHHLLAKATTDAILSKFKSGLWNCCNGTGADFYRVGCDSTFPSPDAAFYDDTKEILVAFEFKPPTETKRGILTGLGQSIAYLNSSNLSYLIIPNYLEDFNIGQYMVDLYKSQINDSLPVGLIIFENNNPQNVNLVHNIDLLGSTRKFKAILNNRFWAKHQDLPIPLFHLILHCFYLKRIGQIAGDAFAYCWEKYMVAQTIQNNLEASPIRDVNNDIIKTLSGKKDIIFFEKIINKIKSIDPINRGPDIVKLLNDLDSKFIGDNHYNAYKKNYITFFKHIGVIDSTGNITEEGFKLYHLGIVNGPSSKIFFDYFTQFVLISGHHLDLIFDLDKLCNQYRGKFDMTYIRNAMLKDYESKGMIKRNPKRQSGSDSKVEFLKYEFILWNSLGLTVKTNGIPNISFNWKKITEICSMSPL